MTVKKQDNGLWMARVSYKDGQGKYKQKSKYTFRTKKEAQLWEQDIQAQLNKGVDITDNPVFADYFLKWFGTYKELKSSNATKVNYKATYNKLVDYFGNAKIKSITRQQYQGFLNHYGQKLAKGTMQKTNKHIRACVQEAIEQGIIQRNFTYKAEISGLSAKETSLKYLSEKESKRLISALFAQINDSMLTRRMAILALATGLRYSEIAGLTFDSFNFNESTLKIEKTWDFYKSDFKPTKTDGSKRTIKVEPSIMEDMRLFINRQRERQLARQLINPHKLVFSTYDGTPPTNAAANKSLKRACVRAGIKEVTFHALRHTHVSILLYKGMDIHSIAKRIGHTSPATTTEVYAHVIDEMQHRSDQLSDSVVSELFST